MGAWGDYDDENDHTADLAYELEMELLPKYLKDLPIHREKPCDPPRKNCKVVYDDKVTGDNRQKQKDWMLNNLCKVQAYLNKQKDMPDGAWAGIALYIARGWGSTPIGHKMTNLVTGITIGESFPLPDLPSNFPAGLKKRAYQDSVVQLDKAEKEGNVWGWTDFKSRKQSLRNQIELFGRGEKYATGSDIKPKPTEKESDGGCAIL